MWVFPTHLDTTSSAVMSCFWLGIWMVLDYSVYRIGLSNLTTVVLGNFAFRYAQRVELDNMPMLRELVLGDESVNFCTALSITNLPRLKTWKIYGKSMNGCVDLKMTGRYWAQLKIRSSATRYH